MPVPSYSANFQVGKLVHPPTPVSNQQAHLHALPKNSDPTTSFSTFTNSITMSRRAIYAVGIPLLGAGGYYLYTAGGDTKVAQKKAERMNSLSKISIGGCQLTTTRR